MEGGLENVDGVEDADDEQDYHVELVLLIQGSRLVRGGLRLDSAFKTFPKLNLRLHRAIFLKSPSFFILNSWVSYRCVLSVLQIIFEEDT